MMKRWVKDSKMGGGTGNRRTYGRASFATLEYAEGSLSLRARE